MRGQRARASHLRAVEDLTPALEGHLANPSRLLTSYARSLRASWRPKLQSERSVKTYVAAVKSYLDFLERHDVTLGEATEDEALDWVAWLKTERSGATAQVYVGALKVWYAWLIERGLLAPARDPFRHIRPPARPERLNPRYTEDEVMRILRSQDPATFIGRRNVALFLVLLDTGLRVSELVSLRDMDIDQRQGYVHVIGKGNKPRIVRLSNEAMDALDRYLDMRERYAPGVEFLWVARKRRRTSPPQPLTVSGVQRLHRYLSEHLGIDMHPHRWRHTMAQDCLDSGMSERELMDLLGHSDAKTLRVYSRASDRERALRAHERHSPVQRLLKGKRLR